MFIENSTIFDNEYLFNSNASFKGTVDPTVIFGPQRDTLYIVIPITVIYVVIFVTGLLGNVFTCTVIIRNKSMHTATNYYLFSLAVSDLLLLVSGMPQEMYSIWSKWPYVFGSAFCLIRGLAAETSTNASILTITLFTIERYLAICHPFQSHKMSKLSRATKHVILLWVAAFMLALPQALQFGIRSHKGVVMCLQTRVIIEHSFEISTFVFFLAPMVLITVLYFLIGLRLNETSRCRVQKDSVRSGESKGLNKIIRRHSQSTRRVVKMLVAVVVAFFICWAPFHAQRLVAIYGTTENHLARTKSLLFIYSILTYFSGIFYYLSTCINPILYHIMCNKFREAFKNTLVWCCCFGHRTARQRLPYSALAFGLVPSFSRSDSNNGVRNETIGSTKRTGASEKKVETPRPHPDCPHSQLVEVQKCGPGCRRHKGQSIASSQENTQSSGYMDGNLQLARDRHSFWAATDSSRDIAIDIDTAKTQPTTVRMNRLNDGENEELEDELALYIKEIKERIHEREMEYK